MNIAPIVLEWTEPARANETCMYPHTKAQTPLGEFLITWKGWGGDTKSHDVQCTQLDFFEVAHDLEDAKEIAQKKFNELVMSCLKVTDT